MPEINTNIIEIFSSIQGEGIFVGAKQIFVRFKDCNLKCSFCDEPMDRPARMYTPYELSREIDRLVNEKGPHHSVSLTGGEPLCHTDFLLEFLPMLRRNKHKVYLETNGTLPEALMRVIDLVDIIAMDFKLPSSTGQKAFWDEHLRFLSIARRKKVFVKAIVTPETTAADIERSVSIVSSFGKEVPFILQPVTPSRKTEKSVTNNKLLEFIEIGIRRDLEHIQVIPQMHKILGVK